MDHGIEASPDAHADASFEVELGARLDGQRRACLDVEVALHPDQLSRSIKTFSLF